MPVENELKFVVKRDIEWDLFQSDWLEASIHQGYLNLNPTIRIRSVACYQKCEIAYFFTFKQLIEDDIIEIECEISHKEFTKLWPSALNTVYKTRYYKDIEDEHWTVDCLIDVSQPYFVMAEVEMPEGRVSPLHMPSIVKNNLLYAVEKNNKAYSNSTLSNVDIASRLYKEHERNAIHH
jgi:CYTH domain-containing protein